MSDVLLTLSALILICSTILPQAIQYMRESLNEKVKYEATIVLYEKLHELLVEGQTPITTEVISSSGKKYEFISNPLLKEVCIHYEDTGNFKKSVCEFWE